MYPLHLRNLATQSYAVANDEAEHKALSERGYEPKYIKPPALPKGK